MPVSKEYRSDVSLDDLDLMGATTPATPNVTTKRCRRHVWMRDPTYLMELFCARCGKVKDQTVSRRSRNNKNRGLAIQREVAKAADMTHMPGNGPADARDSQFYAEIKSGPSWYSVRVEAEMDNLPGDSGRMPLFIAASTPGPGGGKRRVYATVTLGDLVKMVGPHAQVSTWLPEWVAMKREHGVTNE